MRTTVHVITVSGHLETIDRRGSPEVDPEDMLLVTVLLEDWLQALLKTVNAGLASAEDGETRQLTRSRVNINGIG